MRPVLAPLLVSLALLAGCGQGERITIETAWCDEMLESDMMARALRGQTVGQAVARAKDHCVLVPPDTPYSVAQEIENDFGQTYVQARIQRPDTGEEALMWVRAAAAGID
jgi:hypothetical protein